MDCKSCKSPMCEMRGRLEVTCYGYQPLTNGDRIRAMSDEELKDFLGFRSICGHIQELDYEWCNTNGECSYCVLTWLKQPAKEET